MTGPIRPLHEVDEWMDTTGVADLLGVSSERARQVMPKLGGRQWAGKWWAKREAVEDYGRTRRDTTPAAARDAQRNARKLASSAIGFLEQSPPDVDAALGVLRQIATPK